MRLKKVAVTLIGLGICAVVAGQGAVRADGTAGARDTLTEWAIPFEQTSPQWIAAAGRDIVFTNYGGIPYLGRLEPDSGLVTRWPIPYVGTSPGAIDVRSSDRAVFLMGLVEGEIGQADLGAQMLRRWPMPALSEGQPLTPWYLTMARDGTVLFLAYDSANTGYVGRLDTTAATVSLWAIPDSVELSLWQLAQGLGDDVFGNFDGFGPRGVFRLNMATGAFTIWSTSPVEPVYAIATDPAGQLYFQQMGDSGSSIARLVPETGLLTQWPTLDNFQDRLVFAAGHVAFGGMVAPDLQGLVALDVSYPGQDSFLPSPTTQTVTPISVALTPNDQALVGESAHAARHVTSVRRRSQGAFDGWPVAGAPRALAVVPSLPAIYFSEPGRAAIGRITN